LIENSRAFCVPCNTLNNPSVHLFIFATKTFLHVPDNKRHYAIYNLGKQDRKEPQKVQERIDNVSG